MLLTDTQLFGTLLLVWLVIWLIMVIRYLLYVYNSNRVKVQRAVRFASKATNARKWGWLMLLVYPVFFFVFPWVEIVTQNPEIEINEDIKQEYPDYEVTMDDALVRKTFKCRGYMTFYWFNGQFLPLGDYIYNDTDSTLHLYWTRFRGSTPVAVEQAEGGTDIPPGQLVKYSLITDVISNYFRPPSRNYNRDDKKDELKESYTLDVKSLAQKEKKALKEQITYNRNNRNKSSWTIENPPISIDNPVYYSPNSPNKDKRLHYDSVLKNLENVKIYYEHYEPKHFNSGDTQQINQLNRSPEITRDQFQQEIEQMRREMDSVKRIFDRIDSLNWNNTTNSDASSRELNTSDESPTLEKPQTSQTSQSEIKAENQ